MFQFLTPDGADVRPHVSRGLAPLALALEKPVRGNVPFPTALAVHERQVLDRDLLPGRDLGLSPEHHLVAVTSGMHTVSGV